MKVHYAEKSIKLIPGRDVCRRVGLVVASIVALYQPSIQNRASKLTPPMRSLISLSQNPKELVRYNSSNLTRRI